MLVSPVSFSSTTGLSFQDKIKQPQAFVQKDTPVASTTINSTTDEGMSTGKKAGIAVGVAAALATALALVSKKTQLLNPAGEGTGIIETTKKYLKTAGDFIADKAIAGYNFVKSHLPGGKTAEAAPAPTELPPPAAA